MTITSILTIGVLGIFMVGFYALLTTRNMIKIIVALQILVKAALLALITAGYINGNMNEVESMCITVIVADTVVAVIGMALAILMKRNVDTLDIREISNLKG